MAAVASIAVVPEVLRVLVVDDNASLLRFLVSAFSANGCTVTPAAAAPERPVAETAKPAAPAMPQGFEGLKFPNDGVLTRQWMEFLSQMSTTK